MFLGPLYPGTNRDPCTLVILFTPVALVKPRSVYHCIGIFSIAIGFDEFTDVSRHD